MEEIWRDISRYPYCEVSNTGKVRYKEGVRIHGLAKRERPLKLGGFGYYQVVIDGKTESVHNLVAEAFISPKPSKDLKVDHKNDNKLDNRPENLVWLSHPANVIKSCFTGGRRYFYEGEIWLIKKLILSRRVSQRIIGKMFNCSTMLIQDVKKGLKDNHIRYS